VEDFRRQFVQVFPDRRPLLLCPMNECGVRKFVCTTITPCLLPYHKLYNMNSCAKFVADFITYLPLADPTKIPDLLPSSASIVRTRHGDSLDMAVFLCSLLRGARYQAYVVSGYAPKWITTQDQSNIEVPKREEKKVQHRGELEAKEKKVAKVTENKYMVKQPPNLESKFSKWVEEDKKKKRREKSKLTKRERHNI